MNMCYRSLFLRPGGDPRRSPAFVGLVAPALVLAFAGCVHAGISVPPPGPGELTSAPAAQDVPDAASEAQALKSKVSKVTVYSDRARITREVTVKVGDEPKVFVFRGLPGWVDDGSVQVAASGGRIVDVRVDRGFLAEASDEGWRKLEAERKRLLASQAALLDELAVLDAQKAQIEAIKAFSLTKITQDTRIGEVSVQSYTDVLGFISGSLRSTAEARRAVQAGIDDLEPQLKASQGRLDDAKALMQVEETNVFVTLQSSDEPSLNLELTYMLPGVTWEPMHELRASTGTDSSVEVLSYATVTQTSGEDWGGAQVSFSTQSSTQSVRIPELEALTLGDTVTATRQLTRQVSSFTRAETAFQGQSSLWNRVHQNSAERTSSKFEEIYRDNMEYLQVVQGRTVKIFESLERRGTTVQFRAEAAGSVRGDGHPVRLPIGRARLESVQRIVAAPEQSLNAARTLAMTNSTDQPFLPGRVSLFLDGAFIGMTDLDFVAKGEKFALFLSVADHLKLSRELDKQQSSLVRKTRNQMQIAFIVTVENLGATATTLTLADRVPVSENKEIKVSQISVTPATKPDSQGLLHWDLTLLPKEKREFRISYQVEYPAELYIETSRRRAMDASSPTNAYAPKPSSASKLGGVEEQIMDLEDKF